MSNKKLVEAGVRQAGAHTDSKALIIQTWEYA